MTSSFHDQPATVWQHLLDLRAVLLKVLVIIAGGMLAALLLHQKIISFFTTSFYLNFPAKEDALALFSPLEGIAVALKVCFWVGTFGTSPVWLLPIARFIAPGLYHHEKQLLYPFLILALFFMILGAFFGYFVTLPVATHYLFNYNSTLGLNVWSLALYLDFTLFLILANGIAFEMAFILFFLVHCKIISPESLAERRRWAILAAFILGALLTPPDVLTQFFLALPLIFLYEIAIFYGRFRAKLPLRR